MGWIFLEYYHISMQFLIALSEVKNLQIPNNSLVLVALKIDQGMEILRDSAEGEEEIEIVL